MNAAGGDPMASEPISDLAQTHRATAAGMAELAEHHAEAVAALDRTLAARLGDLDRAIQARTKGIDGHLSDAENRLAEAIETGVTEFRRAGSDERRLLHEGVAARLAEVEAVVAQRFAEIERAAIERLAALCELIDRVQELEQAAAARLAEPDVRTAGPTPTS
jgi:hypothetical protein